MNIKQILIVSDLKNENGLLHWNDLSKTFETTLVETDEKAIELANRQHFDLALIDNRSTGIDFKKLSAVLPILRTEIKLVRYEGEPLSELELKLKDVFIKKRNERIKRFLVLDSSAPKKWNGLPGFSAN
jgi:CheY-like chemotaxis protein